MSQTPIVDDDRGACELATQRLKGEKTFAFLLTCAYAAIVLVVCLHHEPWRDEADPWLAARDMSLPELFGWLGPAGTPGLWYLLLMPLAKLGLPYVSMSLLHASLAIASAAVIAFAAPFPRIFKVLILFGKFLLYEYAIIARSYVLTLLLMMLIAVALTRQKKRWWVLGVLLFFLFNTNVHSFCVAGAICVVVTIDLTRTRRWSRSALVGAAIAGLGAVLAFLQILPAARVHTGVPPGWASIRDGLLQMFFPYIPPYIGFFRAHSHGQEWVAEVNYTALHFFSAGLILAILYQLRHAPKAIAIFVLGALPMFYIFATRWYSDERHAGLVFLLLVFAMWVGGWPSPRAQTWASRLTASALSVPLFFSCVAALVWSWKDIRYDYSGSRAAAQFIQANALTQLPIAAFPDTPGESLLPYLPGTRFWYVNQGAFGTFTDWPGHWKAEGINFSDQEIVRRVRQQFPGAPHVLIVAREPLEKPGGYGYELVFQNTEYIFIQQPRRENYYIYVHRHDR
jgi:hypothetical protein